MSGPRWGGQIKHPTKVSEFEIHARLYAGIKLCGFHVRGDVPAKGSRKRLDLVIFENGLAIRIIEVKTKGCADKGPARRQAALYANYGIPIDFVWGNTEAKDYVKMLHLHALAGVWPRRLVPKQLARQCSPCTPI